MHRVVIVVFEAIGLALIVWMLYALLFGTNGTNVQYVGTRDRTGGDNSGAVWYFAKGMETPLARQFNDYNKGRNVGEDINPSSDGMYYDASYDESITEEIPAYTGDLNDDSAYTDGYIEDD